MERAAPRAAGTVAVTLPVAFMAVVCISLFAAARLASQEVRRLRDRLRRKHARRGGAATGAPLGVAAAMSSARGFVL
jgi:uncharacterized membrane protein